MIFLRAVVLVIACVAATQSTTRPATAPADADAAVRADLDRGMDLMDAGKWREARDVLIAASNRSPKSITALHGAGVAALHIDEDKQAAALLGRAVELTPLPNRALAYNTAVARLRANQPLAAGAVLKLYLSGPAAPLDEPALDALLICVRHASEDAADAKKPEARSETAMGQLDDLEAFAEAYSAKLEANHPGLKKWGTSWLAAKDADQRQAAVKKVQTEIGLAMREVQQQEALVQQRKAQLDAVRARGHGVGAVGNKRDELLHAMKVLEEKQTRLDRTHAALANVLPPLPASLLPIDMDENTPPTMTASAGKPGEPASGRGRRRRK